MKPKRQSLAALRRLAREAADTFDRYAAQGGLGAPVEDMPLPTFIDWHGDTRRDTAPRIPHPRTPWQVRPTPEACREAAALLRRNPDTIGREIRAKTPPTPKDAIRDARRLYGDNAAAVLCRQLETIDPEDYHAPTVRRWGKALRQLVREDAENSTTPTP